MLRPLSISLDRKVVSRMNLIRGGVSSSLESTNYIINLSVSTSRRDGLVRSAYILRLSTGSFCYAEHDKKGLTQQYEHERKRNLHRADMQGDPHPA